VFFQRVFRKVFRFDICSFEVDLLGMGRFLHMFRVVSFTLMQTEFSFFFKTFIRFGLVFRLLERLLLMSEGSGDEKEQDGEKSFTGLIL
jgi:hypothetical protein